MEVNRIFKWYDDQREEDIQEKYDNMRANFINQAIDGDMDDLVRHLIMDYEPEPHCCNSGHLYKALKLDKPELTEIIWSECDESGTEIARESIKIIWENAKIGKLDILKEIQNNEEFSNTAYYIMGFDVDNEIIGDMNKIKECTNIDLAKIWNIKKYDDIAEKSIYDATTSIIKEPGNEPQHKYLCWGCDERTKSIKISIQNIGELLTFCICDLCVNKNEYSKLIPCKHCGIYFYIDYTKLKKGDELKGGRCAFMYCNKCLLLPYHYACPVFGYVNDNLCDASQLLEDDKIDNEIRILGK